MWPLAGPEPGGSAFSSTAPVAAQPVIGGRYSQVLRLRVLRNLFSQEAPCEQAFKGGPIQPEAGGPGRGAEDARFHPTPSLVQWEQSLVMR